MFLLVSVRHVGAIPGEHQHGDILSCLQTLQKMMGVRWDIRDIMSQHNAYVDMLVRVMQHTPYF